MKHEEDNIQRSIITNFRYIFSKSLIFAVPNGGRRNVIEATNLKRSGVLAGVSDLIVLHKGKCYFFEVKQPKGKQTDNQKEFETRVNEQGFEYHVIFSFTDLETILNK